MNKRTEEILERIKQSKKNKVAGNTIAIQEKDIDILISEYMKEEKELEKKDKIIDLMAYEISEEDENFQTLHITEIKQYFERKVENEN